MAVEEGTRFSAIPEGLVCAVARGVSMGVANRDQTSYKTGWWYRWGTIGLVAVVFDFFGW